MNADRRLVEERVGLVQNQLQAARARRGGFTVASEEEVIAALVDFHQRIGRSGGVASFDQLISALSVLGERANGDERALVEQMRSYLLEAEAAVLRMESSSLREHAEEAAPLFLRASSGVPALHPDRSTETAVASSISHLAKQQTDRSVRDAVEELASMSLLRRAADEDAWGIVADFERRLLEYLDAAVAYGGKPTGLDVAAKALELARGFPVVDPPRWFAAAFLPACTRGDRAHASLRQLVLEAPRGASEGLIDALSLGSGLHLDELALSLIEEDDRADLLELGLRVCLRRGVIDVPLMLPLLEHPSPAIASLVARCFVRGDAKALAPALVPLLDRSAVAVEAAFTLAVFRAEVGPSFLRAAVDRSFGEGPSDEEKRIGVHAARTLALLGKKRDAAALGRIAAEHLECIPALADHGALELVEWLTRELRETRSTRRALWSARALSRMLGIDPGGLHDEDAEQSLDRAAFLSRIGDGPPKIEGERLRGGKTLELGVLVRELRHPSTPQGVRRSLQREVTLQTGMAPSFDLDGWVTLQSRALRQLEAEARSVR